MKKYAYVFLTWLVIGIIIFTIYVNFFSVPSATNQNGIATTTSPIFSVAVLSREVRLTGADGVHSLSGQSLLKEGDILHTLQTGRAVVGANGDNQMFLNYNTEIRIVRHNAGLGQDSDMLNQGSIWLKAKKTFSQGGFYQIETQNAAVMVSVPSSLSLQYANRQTTLIVASGTVIFVPVDQNTRTSESGKEITVISGKKAIIDDLGNVYISDATTTDTQDPWYIFNNSTSTPAGI